MKLSEIKTGEVYITKINGKLARAKVLAIREHVEPGSVYNGARMRTYKRIELLNLESKRNTVFNSAGKILKLASECPKLSAQLDFGRTLYASVKRDLE